MSYKCARCSARVPHNRPMQRHTVYREVKDAAGRPVVPARTEIDREIPVCTTCLNKLAAGKTTAQVDTKK